MPSLSDELREIAEWLNADAELWRRVGEDDEYSRIKEKVDRLAVIADRLEGKCVVEPIVRRSRYGTWEVKLPVCTAETQFGDEAEAVAALQAELDKQDPSPDYTNPSAKE